MARACDTYAISVVIGSDGFGEFGEPIQGIRSCMAVPGTEGMCRSQAVLCVAYRSATVLILVLVYAYISLRLTDSECVLLYLRPFELKSQVH